MADSNDREGDSAADARDHADSREDREAQERERYFRRLGDSLIGSIWGDSSAAFKRGQGLVTGVAQGTKDELVRMISHEVRGFLDKMDAADLVQEIVSGLVIEMKTEIRFRRDEEGRLEPDVRTSETKVAHDKEGRKEAGRKEAGRKEAGRKEPDPESDDDSDT